MLATGIAEVEQQILLQAQGPVVLSQMEFAKTIEENPPNSYRSQAQPGYLAWSGNSFGVLCFGGVAQRTNPTLVAHRIQ